MADTNTQAGNGNLFFTHRYDSGSWPLNLKSLEMEKYSYLKFDGFGVRTPYQAFDQLHLTPHTYTVQDECLEEKNNLGG